MVDAVAEVAVEAGWVDRKQRVRMVIVFVRPVDIVSNILLGNPALDRNVLNAAQKWRENNFLHRVL